MGQFIVRRLVLMIPVLVGVTILTFILANMLPGDPARELAGMYATREQIEATRQRLGLDQPLPVQYIRYMGRLLQGDLGRSMSSQGHVAKELLVFFPATLELALVSMLLTVILGIPLGIITGTGRSPWVNSAVMLFSMLGVGLPVFWAGLVFQLVFFRQLGILPLSGRLDPLITTPPTLTGMYTFDAIAAGQWRTFLDACRHLVLPSFTLAIGRIAQVARITHASMVEVMRKDYIRTAKAKGLVDRMVISRHALKNALLPTVTTLGLQVAWLMGGALLIENIFSWGGLGTYAWIGIFRLDIPVVMGITLTTTGVFVFANLLTDIAYKMLDPRITY